MYEKREEKEYKPGGAKVFAAVVYVGVAVAATVMFISMVLSAFPEDAYLTRLLMTIAGLLVGASSLAFPIALHSWTVEKNHRKWTTAFYYGEIAIMAVNTVVSFVTLLGAHKGYAVPEWAILYEPFSVIAMVYTLAAWGTVFLLDPEHKRIQKTREADERFDDLVADKQVEFVNSIEGEEVVLEVATDRIRQRYSPERFRVGKTHFGNGRGEHSEAAVDSSVAVEPGRGFVPKQAATSLPLSGSDDDLEL